jgi:RNA polymerase subunit RPABC4/transcription elongation factor Spt4
MSDTKVCPSCKSEYRPEIVECSECGVRLVPAEIVCPACRAPGFSEGRCSSCGAIDEEKTPLTCANHPGKKAKGLCTVCSTPLCSKCIYESPEGHIRCEVHTKSKKSGELILVYEAAPAEIPVLATAFLQSGIQVTLAPLNLCSGCACRAAGAGIYVEKEWVKDAGDLFDRLLYCENCKKAVSVDAVKCPNCGETFE